LYTFTPSRVKTLNSFGHNHAVFARHHTTLPRCDCIGTLRGLYKDSLTYSNPLGFKTKQGIKLPSGSITVGHTPRVLMQRRKKTDSYQNSPVILLGLVPCNPTRTPALYLTRNPPPGLYKRGPGTQPNIDDPSGDNI
jgi:hypothetical protein